MSTCGRISSLKALDYLIHSFESDVVILDCRMLGFTRDVRGRKHYIDHKIDSIQNYLSRDTSERYQMIDVNVCQETIFHTKMRLKEFDLEGYLFGDAWEGLTAVKKCQIRARVNREMLEIYYGRNLRGRGRYAAVLPTAAVLTGG